MAENVMHSKLNRDKAVKIKQANPESSKKSGSHSGEKMQTSWQGKRK